MSHLLSIDAHFPKLDVAGSISVFLSLFVRVLSVCTRQQEPTKTKNEALVSFSLLVSVVGECLETRHESVLKTIVLETAPRVRIPFPQLCFLKSILCVSVI